jgi:hypothetical protein
MKNDTTKNPSNPKCKLRNSVKRSVSLLFSVLKTDNSHGQDFYLGIEEL